MKTQETKEPVSEMKQLRGIIESFYDIQHMRIEVEGRLRAKEQDVSSQEYEALSRDIVKTLKGIETDITKHAQKAVEKELIGEWLLGLAGIGPTLAAGLLAWTEDVEKFQTISKLWAYAGLTVEVDGENKGLARRRRKGEKINWNVRLKTHLWKVGESFVKTKGGYRKLYEESRAEYDAKWLTPEICRSVGCKSKKKCLDAHRYAAAKRKTVKIFLAHFYLKWRELKGLSNEGHLPYIIGRTDHKGVVHTHVIPILDR